MLSASCSHGTRAAPRTPLASPAEPCLSCLSKQCHRWSRVHNKYKKVTAQSRSGSLPPGQIEAGVPGLLGPSVYPSVRARNSVLQVPETAIWSSELGTPHRPHPGANTPLGFRTRLLEMPGKMLRPGYGPLFSLQRPRSLAWESGQGPLASGRKGTGSTSAF